jgi:hypothetical protein
MFLPEEARLLAELDCSSVDRQFYLLEVAGVVKSYRIITSLISLGVNQTMAEQYSQLPEEEL